MNADVIHARVDRQARLIDADAALARLQQRAGGHLPGPIVVPQLATVVATALRFDAPVLRPVYAGEADFDLRFWVHVAPDATGADLVITGWSEEARTGAADDARSPFPLDGPGWTFECDERCTIVGLWAEGSAARIRTRDWIGQTIDALFSPSEEGARDIAARLGEGEAIAGLAVDANVDGVAARAILDVRPSMAGATMTGAVGAIRLQRAQSGDGAGGATFLPGDWGALDRRMDEALRLPIGRIIANAETIARELDGPIAEDYAGYAGDIASAGKHLLGLIDDLADLQAIERAGFEVARERVDLGKVAMQAAGLLNMRARDKQMTIAIEAAEPVAAAVGEFRRVLQILINFIGNAVRYAPDQSRVTVSSAISVDGGEVSVSVVDEGPGIASADQARIFDKFERLGRRDHGGSGLGLYIANRLARAMGGRIDIDSEPGRGARFTLVLPRWPA